MFKSSFIENGNPKHSEYGFMRVFMGGRGIVGQYNLRSLTTNSNYWHHSFKQIHRIFFFKYLDTSKLHHQQLSIIKNKSKILSGF